MLLLALSCLQGRAAADAAGELLALDPDGLQLTPGCAPSPGLIGRLSSARVPVATHHGYTPRALRAVVWAEDGSLATCSDSIHPPRATHPAARRWLEAWRRVEGRRPIVEVMYPGWCLGGGDELAMAMAEGIPLAVDASHLHIQRAAGVLDDGTLRRLLAYDGVAEVHVSDNDGRRDQHRPLVAGSYGLGWAAERAATGTPLVLESAMHPLTRAERARQVELVRERISCY
ncbi:MAG: hypothetical protein OEY23_07345 [Acidimicrobiia bacterium]|nr:hypothetical protein [Acidimicrobiia bacterium]